jgi:hypothetical protein
VGHGALFYNTTGGSNSAVGESALSANTTGGNNTAMGYIALSDNTSGNNNTAVGYDALSSSTTGANNTAVGFHAGENANGASSTNVFIGNGAGPTAAGAISNMLYINNAASDTPLIGGDFSSGYVQINKQLEIPLTSTTPSPNTGYGRVYAKADGNLYYKNASTEYQINGGSLSGGTTNYVMKWNSATTATNSLIFDDGTNVGIGTATPSHVLTVVGGDALVNGLTIGKGLSQNATNTAFGLNAMAATAGSVNSVAIGNNALTANTTGFSMTAIGYQALMANTTGNQNTAVGQVTLKANTTGTGNTAIGDQALWGNTTGNYNTVVGEQAASSSSATTGSYNSGLGYATLFKTTGTYNSVLGAMGFMALTTGGSNTGVGANVLKSLVTGNNNTALGYNAGTNANAASTGNLFLGYGAGPTVAGAVSDTLYINNSQSDTPLIWGDFSAGRVGIGRQATTYALEVAGQGGQTSGGTAWVSLSDRRLKNIEGDYEYGFNVILKLHTVRYHYKKDNPLGLDSVNGKMGVIAQDVMSVIPDAVHQRPDGYYDLNVDPIHWAMVNAVQQLNNKCEMSAHQIETIQQQIKDHDRRLASVENDTKDLRKLVEQQAQMIKQLQSEIQQIKSSGK